VEAEAEAPEAAIFYGSGSGKREMNGSGSSEKILEAEAIKIYRFHYLGIWGKIFFFLGISSEIKLDLDFNKVEAEAKAAILEAGWFQISGSGSGSGSGLFLS